MPPDGAMPELHNDWDPRQILWATGDRIFFATNSEVIDSTGARQLTGIVLWFNRYCAGGKALVTGHTDETGTRNGNLVLSKRRALAVARFFVMRGLDAERIDAVGKGWFEPMVTGHTELSYSYNRRVVIEPKDCPKH